MPLPSSWFYKLRRRGSAARGDDGDAAGVTSKARHDRAPTVAATATSSASSREVLPPCTPNRASYYFPSRDRGVLPCPGSKGNPKLWDTHFPRSPQPNDIVFDVVTLGGDRFDGLRAMPELKLRPIITRPAAKKVVDGEEAEAWDSGTSAAASPTARVRRRFHVKPSGRRKGGRVEAPAAVCRRQRRRARRQWLYESLVVVKESADPEEDFVQSMAEMIAENGGVRTTSPRDLEELLACYLALNAAEHHRAIVAAFRRSWLDATNAKQRLQQARAS